MAFQGECSAQTTVASLQEQERGNAQTADLERSGEATGVNSIEEVTKLKAEREMYSRAIQRKEILLKDKLLNRWREADS